MPDKASQVAGRAGKFARRENAVAEISVRSLFQDTSERQMSETLQGDPEQDKSGFPDTYEAAVAELESIVQSMEAGSLPLEQSLAAYRRGALLAAHCRRLLVEVQHQVRILEDDVLKAFEQDAEDD